MSRFRILVAILVLAVVSGAAYRILRPEPAKEVTALEAATPASPIRPPVPEEIGSGEPNGAPLPAGPPSETEPWLPPGFEADDPAVAWAEVDLESVREAMPDNLYWSLHAPTTDPDRLAERAEEERFWREQRSRVESGNASEEEVDELFEHRFRVHTDAVEFTTHLIDHYGEALPERDLQLLHIARNLHLARIAELPRTQAEAQDLRRQQERARQAWREQQAAFEGTEDEDPDPVP